MARLAYILCAGVGKRLRPLTLGYPKALLPVAGRPMVYHVLDALRRHGIRRFLVNLHAHPRVIRRALEDYGRRHRVRFCFLREKILLDTGGAIRNARRFLVEPFWLVNCDFLPLGFSFAAMERAHRRLGAVATLAVRPMRPGDSFNPVGVDRRGRIVRVSNVFGGARRGRNAVFMGVHRLEPQALAALDTHKAFPIFRGLYRNLVLLRQPIHAYWSNPKADWDLGTIDGYFSANFSWPG